MVDPDVAREEARRILEGDRYQARDVPRPLEGVLGWLGERIQDVSEPVRDLVATPAGLAVALGTVLALAVIAASMAVRRGNRVVAVAAHRERRDRGADPARLEERAEEAEGAGELDLALRLRFRAGVLRLEQAGAVPPRPDMTSRRLVAAVPGADGLARTFDEVAYGERRAQPVDVETARREWPAIVAGAGTFPPEVEVR